MKRLNVNLTDDVHHKFKLHCVEQSTDMSEVTRRLIEQYLKKIEKKRRKR